MDVLLLWKAEENIIIIKNTKKSMPKRFLEKKRPKTESNNKAEQKYT